MNICSTGARTILIDASSHPLSSAMSHARKCTRCTDCGIDAVLAEYTLADYSKSGPGIIARIGMLAMLASARKRLNQPFV